MLKRIIGEDFSKKITGNSSARNMHTYAIKDRLDGYVRQIRSSDNPAESEPCLVNELDIPSIPGGFLKITEFDKKLSFPYIKEVKVRFEYLEGKTPKQDLDSVRNAILASGLEPVVKEE